MREGFMTSCKTFSKKTHANTDWRVKQMREIKFRGKTDRGRWVYGGYYRLFNGLQMDGNHYSHYIVENNHHHKVDPDTVGQDTDRKSTRLNSSHVAISYAVFCLKKKRADHDAMVSYLQEC